MISFISGKIIYKEKDYVIVENGGVGFKVYLAEGPLSNLKIGDQIRVFCFLSFRNERVELYGFFLPEQLKLFERLEKIPGIGAKVALKIATKGSLEELFEAIRKKDLSYFKEIKGLGKKKLQKIILELSGEVPKEEEKISKEDKALRALISLGFSSKEAEEALRQIPQDIDLEERIKKALQILGKIR